MNNQNNKTLRKRAAEPQKLQENFSEHLILCNKNNVIAMYIHQRLLFIISVIYIIIIVIISIMAMGIIIILVEIIY